MAFGKGHSDAPIENGTSTYMALVPISQGYSELDQVVYTPSRSSKRPRRQAESVNDLRLLRLGIAAFAVGIRQGG